MGELCAVSPREKCFVGGCGLWVVFFEGGGGCLC